MKSKWKLLLSLAVFVAVIGTSAALYRILGEHYEEPPPQSDSQTTHDPGPTQPPTQLADAVLIDADGFKVYLRDLIGKPIIINFWATWCGYCVEEMPAFEELYRQKGEEIHILMIDLADGKQETKTMALNYVEENQFTFPVYFSSWESAEQAFGSFRGIPRSYFINSAGEIVWVQDGAITKGQLFARASVLE